MVLSNKAKRKKRQMTAWRRCGQKGKFTPTSGWHCKICGKSLRGEYRHHYYCGPCYKNKEEAKKHNYHNV